MSARLAMLEAALREGRSNRTALKEDNSYRHEFVDPLFRLLRVSDSTYMTDEYGWTGHYLFSARFNQQECDRLEKRYPNIPMRRLPAS